MIGVLIIRDALIISFIRGTPRVIFNEVSQGILLIIHPHK